MSKPPYGELDATFQAAGGEAGIRRLVDRFYDLMISNPDYAELSGMHAVINETTRDKLARFLCGWMGGPRRYQERYGSISIPAVHAHLSVSERERDQWLACMSEALVSLDYPGDFRDYLVEQLARPAEMIRRTAQQNRGSE